MTAALFVTAADGLSDSDSEQREKIKVPLPVASPCPSVSHHPADHGVARILQKNETQNSCETTCPSVSHRSPPIPYYAFHSTFQRPRLQRPLLVPFQSITHSELPLTRVARAYQSPQIPVLPSSTTVIAATQLQQSRRRRQQKAQRRGLTLLAYIKSGVTSLARHIIRPVMKSGPAPKKRPPSEYRKCEHCHREITRQGYKGHIEKGVSFCISICRLCVF